MSYNKTLNILIFDSNPNGLIMGEVSNWNGRVYKGMRLRISPGASMHRTQAYISFLGATMK